jgi:2-hydroxychromene-2-carboxylate isomerase
VRVDSRYFEPMPGTQRPDEPLDFYFDFTSPFAWISAEQVGNLARKHARGVRWHPFHVESTTMGLPALLAVPLKGMYLVHDARRSARLLGLQMSTKAKLVFSPLEASRATLWIERHAPALTERFVLAAYRRTWVDAKDLAARDTVLDVARELGIDSRALSHGLDDPRLEDEFRKLVADSLARGVFGSPTVVVDGETFWGADRLPQVATWLERGGW